MAASSPGKTYASKLLSSAIAIVFGLEALSVIPARWIHGEWYWNVLGVLLIGGGVISAALATREWMRTRGASKP